MYSDRLPIPTRIQWAELAIQQATDHKAIASALAELGYDADEVASGRHLLERVLQWQEQLDTENSEQVAATQHVQELYDDLSKQYDQHSRLAEIAFKNAPGYLTALGLVGCRERDFDRWMGRVAQFYDVALGNSDIQAGLARFNIERSDLKAALRSIEKLGTAQATAQRETSEALLAMQSRDQAMETLDDWMEDFIEVALIALEEQPEHLEALGLQVAMPVLS